MIAPKSPAVFFTVTDDKTLLGNYLYNARVEKNISQSEMARHLGCHQPRVRSMEGLRLPRLENLVRYLDRLDLRLVIVPK